jgi:hypothetical protein
VQEVEGLALWCRWELEEELVQGHECRWSEVEVEAGRVMDGELYGLESFDECERTELERERERLEG